MEKKSYQVGATPILLDGERSEPGDLVGLTDKEAARLGEHVSPAASEAADVGRDSKTTKKGGEA
ncbi:hypothetical protein JW897_21800 [Chromobacterium alkanivorans]|uniref:hypothetical protein n=1 Tax=Chromobacterium alkanivorans TaxID=1071719 RepID=UPI0019677E90|nr:hypothetical protein [Chromobacterium alkanivorans]MBN3006381.1 hypothetical protein [Chromobacterium alkanivorans]